MSKKFELHKGDANTLVCQSFSDSYHGLNQYILNDGIKTESRLGPTYEILNFKTVIQNPLYRCTVSLNRNINIFFHLAESIWVITGRNDLEFMEIFNSRFQKFSDDGKTLHGAYGKRLRKWNNAKSNEILDQLFKISSLLNSDPDLRRSVISFWDPLLDLGNSSKDIPCNTQLVLRVKDNDLYLTIFNRSNDLHWGYIANIFQFSFLGEIISLLLNKNYSTQTHFSQSLHIYTENTLVRAMAKSDIHNNFYTNYKPCLFSFNFNNSIENFKDRFVEIDIVFKEIAEIILDFNKTTSKSFQDILDIIEPLHSKSKSIYEIAYLLLLFVSYRKELKAVSDKNDLRVKYADYLLKKNYLDKFQHSDYFALALNYFVRRMDNLSKLEFTITDYLMGQY